MQLNESFCLNGLTRFDSKLLLSLVLMHPLSSVRVHVSFSFFVLAICVILTSKHLLIRGFFFYFGIKKETHEPRMRLKEEG